MTTTLAPAPIIRTPYVFATDDSINGYDTTDYRDDYRWSESQYLTLR